MTVAASAVAVMMSYGLTDENVVSFNKYTKLNTSMLKKKKKKTLYMTRATKIDTLFMTRVAKKYPLGLHVPV